MFHWTAKNIHCPPNAMNACAELQIDCTPMEGFESDDYNQKLGLSEKGVERLCVWQLGIEIMKMI